MKSLNYDQVLAFLDKVSPEQEDVLHFKNAYQVWTKTGKWQTLYKVWTSEWQNINGVMLMKHDDISDADYRVFLTAKTERALRELLLSFPRQSVGMFRSTEDWIENRIQHIIEGKFVHTDSGRYFRGTKRRSPTVAEQGTVEKRKGTIASHFRKLNSLKGKLEHSQFIVEGEMMVERTVQDGLPIEAVLYTANYVQTQQSANFFKRLTDENISHYFVNDGVMGSVTTTRPVPSIVASVHLTYSDFLSDAGQMNFHYSHNCTLLIAENIKNPDNLGMTLRTADAAGVSAVLLSDEGANPFHKNCVRASRGTVGRLPMFYTPDTNLAIQQLKEYGWRVLGATAKTENELYKLEYTGPTAIVVGNENSGLSSKTCNACTELVRIPMAPGQSSLNVGVAAGVILYELARQKSMRT